MSSPNISPPKLTLRWGERQRTYRLNRLCFVSQSKEQVGRKRTFRQKTRLHASPLLMIQSFESLKGDLSGASVSSHRLGWRHRVHRLKKQLKYRHRINFKNWRQWELILTNHSPPTFGTCCLSSKTPIVSSQRTLSAAHWRVPPTGWTVLLTSKTANESSNQSLYAASFCGIS